MPNFNRFTTGKTELSFAFPLFYKTAARVNLEGGVTIGGTNVYSLDFFLGGNNKNVFGNYGDISMPDSKVRVLVIPTDEELVIARDVERFKNKK